MMGAPLPPRPMSYTVREIFDLGPNKSTLAPDLAIQAQCPIYLWSADAPVGKLGIYQNTLRTDDLFSVVRPDETTFGIVQRPAAKQTKEDFLIIACPVAFGAVDIRAGNKAFIEIEANAEAITARAGANSRIALKNMRLTCADLRTGPNSRINLLCAAEDITARMGQNGVLSAHEHPIARLDATLGHKGSLSCTSVGLLSLTAQPSADVAARARNCAHTIAAARKNGTLFIDMIGNIERFSPVLLGDDSTIVATANKVHIFDPAQMPPKKGGKIVLNTNREPTHLLSNGCCTPRASVVHVIVPKI